MPKPKGGLNLKWTSVDEEAKQWRRAQRAARYKAESSSSRPPRSSPTRSASPNNPFSSTEPGVERHPLEDEFNAHHLPPESLQKLREEIEEARFRAKLMDAMADDERLDQLEASFNAHIPARWSTPDASGSSSSAFPDGTGDASGLDPSYMTEEQYTEWIRQGMWRRTHRTEVESAERRAQGRAAQKERERKAQEVVDKEERERERRRAERKKEKEKKAREQAWDAYRRKWEMLTRMAAEAAVSSASASAAARAPSPIPPQSRGSHSQTRASSSLRFTDVPWPMHPPPNDPSLLTKSALSLFLFSKDHSHDKTRKQRIREALLAYHPDRFVGRYMPAIRAEDQKEVQETVVIVTGFLNALAEEHASG